MTRMLREHWLALLFVAASFAVVVYFYPALPETIPVHRNFTGEADRWAPKVWGAFTFPLAALVVFTLCLFVPRLRGGAARAPAPASFRIVTAAVMAFFLYQTVVTMLAATGATTWTLRHVFIGWGLLLMVLGSFARVLPRNRLAGFRTLWSFSSDDAWRRTQIFGERALMVLGIIVLALAFVPGVSLFVPVLLVVAAAVLVALYSRNVAKRPPSSAAGE